MDMDQYREDERDRVFNSSTMIQARQIERITEQLNNLTELSRMFHNSICELRERVAMLEQVEKDGE